MYRRYYRQSELSQQQRQLPQPFSVELRNRRAASCDTPRARTQAHRAIGPAEIHPRRYPAANQRLQHPNLRVIGIDLLELPAGFSSSEPV